MCTGTRKAGKSKKPATNTQKKQGPRNAATPESVKALRDQQNQIKQTLNNFQKLLNSSENESDSIFLINQKSINNFSDLPFPYSDFLGKNCNPKK